MRGAKTSPDVGRLERRLSIAAADAVFDDSELVDVPEPVARYFRAAGRRSTTPI